MPTSDRIPAKTAVTYTVPVPRGRVVEFHVESDLPIDTFVLDPDGFAEFKTGADPAKLALGGLLNRREHHQVLELPRGIKKWHLVMNNMRNGKDAHVSYEVLY